MRLRATKLSAIAQAVQLLVAPANGALLQEIGDYILLEDGGLILL